MRLWLLLCLLLLSSCGPRATYIQGGQGSTAALEINAVTGSGHVTITGPFTYCSEAIVSKRAPSGTLCGALYEDGPAEPPQPVR